MATVTQATTPTLSGLNYIDALLGSLPQWNYKTSGGNSIYYTFSTSAKLESGNSAILSAPQTFSASQQTATRGAMAYVSQLTGINFVETADGNAAQVHFANANISGSSTTGQASSSYSYSAYSGGTLASYTASSYIYLDNAEWAAANGNLAAGTQGYETLLHEIGHMLGLKHSFDGTIKLPAADDNTSHTLMSYTHVGGYHSSFAEYDVAALKWLYGGDGLAGALGVNSTTGARYLAGTALGDTLTGTAYNDKLEGDGGNDTLDGGLGTDTAVFNGARSAYTVQQTGATSWSVSGAEGVDLLNNIEQLKFSDLTMVLMATTDTGTTSGTTTGGTSGGSGGHKGGHGGKSASTAFDMADTDAVGDGHVQLVGHHGMLHFEHALA